MKALLDQLEQHYGVQHSPWPADAYQFLVWWNCGYPASDAACAKGWASLVQDVGIEPDRILAAPSRTLEEALRAGGIVPDVRADRLKQLADRTLEEFGGDLTAILKALPLSKARAVLKSFEGIGDPGADRILLFAGISPVAAVPSNSPQVLVRIRFSAETGSYNRTYKQAQQVIESGLAPSCEARTRAYLLLKRHGEQICRRSAPRCAGCPVAGCCGFAKATG